MGPPLNMESTTPAVESGPTTWRGTDGTLYSKLSIMQLIEKKEETEAELRTLSRVLDSHKVDMFTLLTTSDGFPRSDIDVTQVRSTRARVIHIRNDYKVLMELIEEKLHEHHARAPLNVASRTTTTTAIPPASAGSASSAVPDSGSTASVLPTLETPFAKVGKVIEGSPAAEAGLQLDDQIRKFGSVTWLNHEKLAKLRELVQRSEGRTILVKVLRKGTPDEELELELKPRHGWGGSGMLGCTVVPI